MIDLAKMGLYGCGTMHRNRKGFPQSLKKISKQGMKERGASKTVQYKNLKYIFWFLFDVAISNTYFLARAHCGLKSSLKDTGVQLAKALVNTYCSHKRPGRPPVNPRRFIPLSAVHFPVKQKEKRRTSWVDMKLNGTATNVIVTYVTLEMLKTPSSCTTSDIYRTKQNTLTIFYLFMQDVCMMYTQGTVYTTYL